MNRIHQMKVQRNLSGLHFLLNRPDTQKMLPQSAELDKLEGSPGFFVCRSIMRDGLTVICISLRVNITTYENRNEKYIYRDIHGRGTTFEMALFDLSANLVSVIEDNDVIDTESLPIINEGKENDNSNTSIRTDKPGSPVPAKCNTEQDAGSGLAARSNNTGGSGADAKRRTGSGRKAKTGRGGSRGTKRSG